MVVQLIDLRHYQAYLKILELCIAGKFKEISSSLFQAVRSFYSRVRKIRRKQVCRRKTRLRKFRLIGKRQCTPKGQARYVNVRGNVQWKGVYRVGSRYWVQGAKFDCGEIS